MWFQEDISIKHILRFLLQQTSGKTKPEGHCHMNLAFWTPCFQDACHVLTFLSSFSYCNGSGTVWDIMCWGNKPLFLHLSPKSNIGFTLAFLIILYYFRNRGCLDKEWRIVQHVAAMATQCHWPLGLQMSLKWSVCIRFKQHITQWALWSIPGLTSSFHLWLNKSFPFAQLEEDKRRGNNNQVLHIRIITIAKETIWNGVELKINIMIFFIDCLVKIPPDWGVAEGWR